MKKLLSTEWLKIKDYAAFKILSLFFIVGVFGANYVGWLVNRQVVQASQGGKTLLSSFQPFSFEYVWQTASYISGYVIILPAMLIIILVTNEFSFRTHRQNIIDGWSRKEFVEVKLVIAFIFAVIATIVTALAALTFGLLSSGDFSLHGIENLGFFFLKCVSYFMFAVFTSVLVRKTGFAIGLYFIYLAAENALSAFLDFYVSVKLKLNGGFDAGLLGEYLPLNSADGLLGFPENPFKSMATSILPTDYFWLTLTLAIAWICLFVWWARRRFMKSDL